MGDFTIQITERRQPDSQNVRLQVSQFEERLTSPAYHHTVHEVMYVTEHFHTFLKAGLPYNRMMILRTKLIAMLKSGSHHQ